jgi:sensor c-di-GMP phosphodiesterase-like protein
LKIRSLYRLSRVWLSLSAVILGILAGYVVGRESVLHSVESRLGDYADRVLHRDEEVAEEITDVLDRANQAKFAYCSDQDIGYLRRLTFAARFLKDVGRLHSKEFLCSATTGKLAKPIPLMKPDITFPSGHDMFFRYPLQVPAGEQAEIVANRTADVVLNPDVFLEFPQRPIQFAVGVPYSGNLAGAKTAGSGGFDLNSDFHSADSTKGTPLSGIAGTFFIPAGVLDSPRAKRVGKTLYRARCSSRYTVCAVTSVAVTEIWRGNRTLMIVYVATGGVAGIACASMLLMVGKKRRSHTNQLKRAILMEKLSVAYQPIVELSTRRIVGAEALARWVDEDGESIRPETIIALAEAEGFVSEITRFVLTRALEEIKPILESNHSFQLNINLAPSDLADPRLLLLLDERLRGSLVAPANIAFELSERATSDRDTAIAAILRLRERGHCIYIDDFGSGYSNLAYLTELNVDGIKINRSFIATIGTDSVTASIVPQILAVAKALGLSVVVQGIEREEQATYFAAGEEAILGQGWFFGLPIPASGLIYLCAEKSE